MNTIEASDREQRLFTRVYLWQSVVALGLFVLTIWINFSLFWLSAGLLYGMSSSVVLRLILPSPQSQGAGFALMLLPLKTLFALILVAGSVSSGTSSALSFLLGLFATILPLLSVIARRLP